MAPKRARTDAASASSSSSSSQPAGAAAPKLTLCGGVPHHASLVALWHDDRLTDFAVSAEGVEFKAHRVALASSSKYFLNLLALRLQAQSEGRCGIGSQANLGTVTGGGLCLYDPDSNSYGLGERAAMAPCFLPLRGLGASAPLRTRDG